MTNTTRGGRQQHRNLRRAVRAAVKAYKKTGHMLDAALAYAAHGFPVFPLTARKTPVPRRDEDECGEPVPGTGGFKKATTDPIQIHKWWDRHEYLIGLRMGAPSGVWTLDVDTSEDHADGVAEWNALLDQHTQWKHVSHPGKSNRPLRMAKTLPIRTREHRSATGGPHLIFNWTQPIGNSTGSLPDGISVKGDESYIVVPPSRRKGRSYTVHRDLDPADAPQWLIDLILQGRTPSSTSSYSGQVTADFDEIAEAMSFIPNDDLPWEKWKSMGMRLYAATGGEGIEIFDAWSSLSSNYCVKITPQQAWNEIKGSPPNRTGVGAIFKLAREHGWERKAKPTYSLKKLSAADKARREVQRIVDKFLHGVTNGFKIDPFKRLSWENRGMKVPPAVWAVWVDTGTGKTRITIAALARWLLAEGIGKSIVYAVPTHALAKEVTQQFRELGINARMFIGRDAVDPEHEDPKKSKEAQVKMCLAPEIVANAIAVQADVTKTCCKDGKKECPLKTRCGYFRQQEDNENVQVWVVASDMLFFAQRALGKPALVIIDEAYWGQGLRGVERKEDDDRWSVAIDAISNGRPDHIDHADDASVLAGKRHYLAEALRQQDEDGGIERRHLEELDEVYDCDRALRLEWNYYGELVKRLGLYPGMSGDELRAAMKKRKLIDNIKHTRRVIRIWGEVRNVLEHKKIEVSGRLRLMQDGGQRVVDWRGISKIREQFRVPTLLLDATLPDLEVLKVYHSQVERVADIRVAMPPAVSIKQVIGAPTSSSKLVEPRGKNTEQTVEKHRQEIRRYILKRWIETGRQATLVICQQEVENWLRGKLPENIALEHFNNITGVDKYKDVRLEILVGRVAPGPVAIEAIAGALSGAQPVLIKDKMGYTGYPQVKRGIQIAGKKIGRGVEGDQHPDPFAECIRWLICEGELLQALGRARGVNRDASCPLDIDILSNVVLPVTVDEVSNWEVPSLFYATAVDGVMPVAPVDMVKLRPDLWPNITAANRSLGKGVPTLPGFERVAYQVSGARMKPRHAWFDRSIVPDPQAWLAGKLGALARPAKRRKRTHPRPLAYRAEGVSHRVKVHKGIIFMENDTV